MALRFLFVFLLISFLLASWFLARCFRSFYRMLVIFFSWFATSIVLLYLLVKLLSNKAHISNSPFIALKNEIFNFHFFSPLWSIRWIQMLFRLSAYRVFISWINLKSSNSSHLYDLKLKIRKLLANRKSLILFCLLKQFVRR